MFAEHPQLSVTKLGEYFDSLFNSISSPGTPSGLGELSHQGLGFSRPQGLGFGGFVVVVVLLRQGFSV